MLADLSQKNQILLRLSSLFWTSMDWLYPPHCCNCGSQGAVFCLDCISEVKTLKGNLCYKCGYPIKKNQRVCANCRLTPPPYQQMRSWAEFTGSLKEAIHALKYKKNLALGSILADPLTLIIGKSSWDIDLIVPIPLSRARIRQRGYNQAALIALNVALKMGIPYSDHAVKRVKHTETQISLDVNKRFMNLMDAFYANPATLINKKVLVIDDVVTTGATMQNCSIAILKAGADKVYCLSVARAILRHPKQSAI